MMVTVIFKCLKITSVAPITKSGNDGHVFIKFRFLINTNRECFVTETFDGFMSIGFGGLTKTEIIAIIHTMQLYQYPLALVI
jgi:hypothetical protein